MQTDQLDQVLILPDQQTDQVDQGLISPDQQTDLLDQGLISPSEPTSSSPRPIQPLQPLQLRLVQQQAKSVYAQAFFSDPHRYCALWLFLNMSKFLGLSRHKAASPVQRSLLVLLRLVVLFWMGLLVSRLPHSENKATIFFLVGIIVWAMVSCLNSVFSCWLLGQGFWLDDIWLPMHTRTHKELQETNHVILVFFITLSCIYVLQEIGFLALSLVSLRENAALQEVSIFMGVMSFQSSGPGFILTFLLVPPLLTFWYMLLLPCLHLSLWECDRALSVLVERMESTEWSNQKLTILHEHRSIAERMEVVNLLWGDWAGCQAIGSLVTLLINVFFGMIPRATDRHWVMFAVHAVWCFPISFPLLPIILSANLHNHEAKVLRLVAMQVEQGSGEMAMLSHMVHIMHSREVAFRVFSTIRVDWPLVAQIASAIASVSTVLYALQARTL
eukprot:gb/GEZN01006841.1/.p1 GENE.gb/GEZN01006841.1/~~gb/GEZN01006841.1/.p1  ORF type:complete len:444 (-),score=38.72 gb/GEZN01006841.1/:136-1467(-)